MPVTQARRLTITENDQPRGGGGGGAYASIEVPADYEAECVDVDEYPKEGTPRGWVITYKIMDLPFKEFLSWSKKARWKIVKTFEAHGYDLDLGEVEVDPNILIGDVVGAHLDMDDEDKYREIKYLFNLDDAVPEEGTTPAPPPFEDDEGEVPAVL